MFQDQDEYILFCVFAKESIKKMNGNRGKLASMAGHAYLHSVWDAEDRFPQAVHDYQFTQLAKKITLVTETVDELKEIKAAYQDICGVTLVEDKGLTVFGEPTIVCVGVGPILRKEAIHILPEKKVLI